MYHWNLGCADAKLGYAQVHLITVHDHVLLLSDFYLLSTTVCSSEMQGSLEGEMKNNKKSIFSFL